MPYSTATRRDSRDKALRSITAAASLKHLILNLLVEYGKASPQHHRCGLIEAEHFTGFTSSSPSTLRSITAAASLKLDRPRAAPVL